MTGSSISEPAAEPTLDLSFDRAVPRELVHKAAIEQVLLTDVKRVGDEGFAFAGQLPRAHRLFNDTLHGLHDTMTLLEAARQGVVVGVHALTGLPRERQFVLGEVTMSVHDLDALRVGPEPARLTSRSATSDWRYVKGQLVSLRIGGDLYVDGRPALAIAGMGGFMDDRLYRFIRRRQRAADDSAPAPAPDSAAAPETVGRRDPANVVITAPRPADGDSRITRARVVVDGTHHTFFDHALDHVPAMLLVEAMRQATVASAWNAFGLDPAGALVTSCRAAYGRYAEHGAAIHCEATLGEPGASGQGTHMHAELRLLQFGSPIGEGALDLAFPSA